LEGKQICVTGSNQQAGAPSKAGAKRTRLQQWVRENGFTSAQLEQASGISRQSMTKIRAGADARKRTMLRILSAARKLKGPEVEMLDLFDLEPESPENQT
jgi:predicted transcriptional regulator